MGGKRSRQNLPTQGNLDPAGACSPAAMLSNSGLDKSSKLSSVGRTSSISVMAFCRRLRLPMSSGWWRGFAHGSERNGIGLLWLKALHVIAVISWMAGMLYLPRLFVYHAEADRGSQLSETFKIMERRLLRIIINPAMIVVWVTGPILGFAGKFFGTGWLDAKVLLVIALSGLHGYFAKTVREFAADKNHPIAVIFQEDQRGTDGLDDCHRGFGRGQAVLKGLWKSAVRILSAGKERQRLAAAGGCQTARIDLFQSFLLAGR